MTETQQPATDVAAARPPVNVYEAGGELSVVLPIPGAHAQNVVVVVGPERLRVDAPRRYPQARQNYLRRDWPVGEWTIELDLPRRVDPARSHATLNLGVLVVMAPVSAEGRGEHRPAVETTGDREGAHDGEADPTHRPPD